MLRGEKWLIFVLVFAFPLQGFARTVKDELGRSVNLPKEIRRIVSLSPSSTENLFAIGAGHLVVGVTSACDYPPQAKKLTQVGDFMKPSLERIAALKPDLLIVVSSTIPKAIANELQSKAKVPVFVFQFQTISSVLHGLLVLGELTGRKQQAQKLVRNLEKRLKAIELRSAGKIRPKVVVEIAPPPSLMVAGPKNFIDDAIQLAGGENAFSDAPRPFPLISLETLVAKDPDAYIVPVKGKTNKQVLEEFKRRSGFENLRCVQNGRVYAIDTDLIFRPTPRLIEGIEKLAQVLHPK
ncbi:MAG: cobalamin-binding protein [Armatimonadetes bacterium]|nr:cobalamin-binding protein [Armatimonadota bacterium]